MTVVIGHSLESRRHKTMDFDRNPMIVYWEMTQACGLACRHCRAEAVKTPHPQQLSSEESRRLLEQLSRFGEPMPHLILTGGDPLERKDLFEIIDRAQVLGLQVSITPSVTEKLTREMLTKLKARGIQALGLSLDGSCAKRHEGVRGIDGCFDRTMHIMKEAGDLGLPIQVNTLVSRETVDDLPAIYERLLKMKIMRWSLFFLIGVGRGKSLNELPADEAGATMEWIYEVAKEAPFAVKTTEAPSFRRVSLEKMRAAGMTAAEIQRTSLAHGFGFRDGNGIMFVSNTGEIFPAGFLPVSAGNVRWDDPVEVYRTSPLFRSLRKPEEFKGKCGVCEFHRVCGGSRARAFAHTGDPLASDPVCDYQPDAARMKMARPLQENPLQVLR